MQTNNKKFYYSTWFIILWIIIFFPVGFYLLYKRCTQNSQNQRSRHNQLLGHINNRQRYIENATQRSSNNQTQVLSRQQENEIINDILIDDMILDDIVNRFKAIPNWKQYRKTTHSTQEQKIRMKRALYGGAMQLLSYDTQTGNAFVHGQSSLDYHINANGCTCEDFRRRQKPCKHMYFVAIYAPLNLPSVPLIFSEHQHR